MTSSRVWPRADRTNPDFLRHLDTCLNCAMDGTARYLRREILGELLYLLKRREVFLVFKE